MVKDKKKNQKKIIATIVGAIVAIAVIVVSILAINSNNEQIVTLQSEKNGATITMTYYAKGDRVYKQTSESLIPYSSLGVRTEAEAREMFGDLLDATKDIDGYSDTLDYKDDHVVEVVIVDYDVVDIDKIKNLLGNYYSGDASNGISLSKSVEWLEQSGFKKVGN